MSNHVHLLLATPRGILSKMMQPFQTSYTVYFNKRHGRSGHVFEQRYKAMVVDKDNYLLEVSRYIHLNPVGQGRRSAPRLSLEQLWIVSQRQRDFRIKGGDGVGIFYWRDKRAALAVSGVCGRGRGGKERWAEPWW